MEVNTFVLQGSGNPYNALFKENPKADVILNSLGVDRNFFIRYRDVWIRDGQVAVYTRMGRQQEHDSESKMPKGIFCTCRGCRFTSNVKNHPLFKSIQNDKKDSTYATVYFDVPESIRSEFKAEMSMPPINMDVEWYKRLNDDTLMKESAKELGLDKLLGINFDK